VFVTSISIVVVLVRNYELYVDKMEVSSYQYEWLQTYGYDGVDKGFGIDQDSEMNIYISGFQDGAGPLCLLKYNSNGSLLWNRTWGHGEAYDLVIDDMDNIYITGHNSAIFLLKLNSSGHVLLNKTWMSTKYVVGNAIDIDDLGNIYITGYSAGIGQDNNIGFLLKCNATGDLEWNQTFGLMFSEGFDVKVTDFGGILVTGYLQVSEQNWDLCLLKYNSTGNLEWTSTWGESVDECGRAIAVDSSGNIYITGYKRKSLNNNDLCLISYNSSGDLRWTKIWGGDEDDFGLDITLDNSGLIYIVGATGSFRENTNIDDILLVKFDKQGNCISFKTWGEYSGTDYGFGLVLDNQGFVYLTGTMIVGYNHFVDIFLLKYDLAKFPIDFSIPGYNVIYFCIISSFFSVILVTFVNTKAKHIIFHRKCQSNRQ
jgi:hypothetical protein